MNLENKLFELSTLVDYGTYFLKKASSLDNIDTLQDVHGTYEVLSQFYDSDIVTYAVGNIRPSLLLTELYDHLDTNDIMDIVTDCWGDDEVQEYIKRTYALADMVEWN